MIFKASTLFHLSFDLTPTPLDSPLYPQLRTILIHSFSFQIFQNSVSASLDQICQIWWNSYLHSPKNSTKIQATYLSNEKPLHQVSAHGKSLHAWSILSNTWATLFLCKFSKFSLQCRLRPSVSVTRPQCPWHVPRRLFLLSEASHACVEPSWRR